MNRGARGERTQGVWGLVERKKCVAMCVKWAIFVQIRAKTCGFCIGFLAKMGFGGLFFSVRY